MSQEEFTPQTIDHSGLPVTRIGDLSAMLRIMSPLNDCSVHDDPKMGRRRLLADLCRFIGVKVGSLPPEALGLSEAPGRAPATLSAPGELSPRLEQTLRHLLSGDSEKQVAIKLKLSQHTVHVYVKALYRRFDVSSRAELLAKHLMR